MELTENIARGLERAAPLIRELGLVFVFLSGLIAVCYGIWLVYEPAAFIAAGLLAAGMVALYVRGS